MGIFDRLTEARIREWQERSPEQKAREAAEAPAVTGAEPMEVQLFKEIIDLQTLAGSTLDPTVQNELMAKAAALEIQLMEVLEQSGRPLAARQVAANIRRFVAKKPADAGAPA